MIQPALINLHPHEYSQEFDYYPFALLIYKNPISYECKCRFDGKKM